MEKRMKKRLINIIFKNNYLYIYMSIYKDKYIKYKKKYIDLKNKISGGSDSKTFTREDIAKNVSNYMFEKADMDVKEPTYAKFKEAVMILISNTSNFEEGERKFIIDMFNRMPQEPTNENWAEIA